MKSILNHDDLYSTILNLQKIRKQIIGEKESNAEELKSLNETIDYLISLYEETYPASN